MIEHILKTVEPYFSLVWNREKLFEVRYNDRQFEVGDKIKLISTKPSDLRYINAEIGYILKEKQYVKNGYVVIQLINLENKKETSELLENRGGPAMSKWKRECVDCIHFKDGYCPIIEMEIIVGRVDVADDCRDYKKKEGNPRA